MQIYLTGKAIFSAGGMFRHKTRDNFTDSYTLAPYTLIPGTSNAELDTSIPAATFTYADGRGNPLGTSTADAGTYTFTENIHAVYGMVKYFVSDHLGYFGWVKRQIHLPIL